MTLVRDEQKLVDTMMVADLIYYARDQNQVLAVVTSDDDIWAGIKSVLLSGSSLFHIHTRPGRKTPHTYSKGAGANYTEISL